VSDTGGTGDKEIGSQTNEQTMFDDTGPCCQPFCQSCRIGYRATCPIKNEMPLIGAERLTVSPQPQSYCSALCL
jgi:hypothetical protein